MITERIKSIEIFPNLSGKFQEIASYPNDLKLLILPYRENNKQIIIRIYETKEKMQKIYDLCYKYDIRCQKYIS